MEDGFAARVEDVAVDDGLLSFFAMRESIGRADVEELLLTVPFFFVLVACDSLPLLDLRNSGDESDVDEDDDAEESTIAPSVS